MARSPGTDREEDGALPGELVDEFTVPGNRRKLLLESQARVQSLFTVQFKVLGSLENFCHEHSEEHEAPERIWVQLRGKAEAVSKAKEYIKGISDPEMQTSQDYPKEMHCIFTGAHSFFLNSLIRDTCASIAVLGIGSLCIGGGTEPVVMAESKVQQFVKIFRENGSLPPPKELEVKRRFKIFVEAHADKYTMDLLLLPSALKEELLNLIPSEDSLPALDDTDLEITAATTQANDLYSCHQDEARPKTQTPVTELMCQLDSAFPADPEPKPTCPFIKQERLKSKRRGSEKENECRKKPFSLEEIQVDGPVVKSGDASEVPFIDLVSDAEEPEVIVLDESIVLEQEHIVLEQEPIVLDQEPISAETEHKIVVNFFETMGYAQDVVEKVLHDLGESEETLKLLREIDRRSKLLPPNQQPGNSQRSQKAEDVIVVEAVSQPKQEVTREPVVCPGPSNGRFTKWSTRIDRTDGVEAERTSSTKNISFVARGTANPPPIKRLPAHERPGPSNQPPVIIVKEIPVKASNMNYPAAPSSNEIRPTQPGWPARPDARLSGVQVFLNTIKTPYKLELKYDPGRADLKHIIIDGSNVAMSHGLQRFYSCRGIAIAVEHFWKKGHRKITVFVPQWRTKRDPSITEQHFLQQLEELGILSFTPARTVMGSRIAAHDDRFLLHLAEKTGGIIVTNDNLREFVVESPAWMEIIKERLLQYTFVGDIFMLPDDPLGRHGPKLEEFLSTQRLGHRLLPLPPPPDSGVFFSNQDPPFSRLPTNTALVKPRFFPPRPMNPAIANLPRPRPTVPPQRSYYETLSLKDKLLLIFPETEQREKINQILSAHPYMRDLNALSAMILD